MSTRIEYVSNKTDTPKISLGVAPYDTTIAPLVSSLSGVDIQGNLKTKNISATFINARDLLFSTLENPALTGVKEALESLLYVQPEILSFTINGQSQQVYEIGQSVNNLLVQWTTNKANSESITSLTLTYPNLSAQTLSKTATQTTDLSTYSVIDLSTGVTQVTRTWSFQFVDWKGTTTNKNAAAIWRPRMYLGKTPNLNLTDANIKTLVTQGSAVSDLVNSRTGLGTRQFTFAGDYYFFAYPQRFDAAPLIRINNNNSTNFVQTTYSGFINNAGGVDDYYVYYSTNRLFGTFQLQIV